MQGKQLSVIVRKAIQAARLERFADTHPNAAPLRQNGCRRPPSAAQRPWYPPQVALGATAADTASAIKTAPILAMSTDPAVIRSTVRPLRQRPRCRNPRVATTRPAGSDDAHNARAIKHLPVAGASDDP